LSFLVKESGTATKIASRKNVSVSGWSRASCAKSLAIYGAFLYFKACIKLIIEPLYAVVHRTRLYAMFISAHLGHNAILGILFVPNISPHCKHLPPVVNVILFAQSGQRV